MSFIRNPGRICIRYRLQSLQKIPLISTAYHLPVLICQSLACELSYFKDFYSKRFWSSLVSNFCQNKTLLDPVCYQNQTVLHPVSYLLKLRPSVPTLHLLNICSLLLVSPLIRTSSGTALFSTSQRTALFSTSQTMAKSKFEYVRQFETEDSCLPNCWIVVRIDGKAFHRFTDIHGYTKPNDDRGLSLMTKAAKMVMADFNDVLLAYGQSDEYSFVLHKDSQMYNRRASKIMTNIVSLFASSFTMSWPEFFTTQELKYPPTFDARVVLYPSEQNLRDYLSWRQADCHINNLYNTCFWKLVQEKGITPKEASQRLKGTLSSDKNELLFSEFNTNYNNLPELYRKGTVVIRPKPTDPPTEVEEEEEDQSNQNPVHQEVIAGRRKRFVSIVSHTDIINKRFWEEYPHILNNI